VSAPPTVRFAPSPNGRLHLGHAYSALRNDDFARRAGGRFLLRIDDIDAQRSKPEFESAIIADLAWLGMNFNAPPRLQSESLAEYASALEALQARGLVYPGFCARAAPRRDGARDPDGAPLYDGTCRRLSASERDSRLAAGARAVMRIDMARALPAAPLTWIEYGEGDAPRLERANPTQWGDAILRGRGLPASYHLCVVVDDAAQGVTDVIRGRDLFQATSLHRLLQTLLGLPAPRYHHHRLALDASDAKLSKSRDSRSLKDARDAGVTPAQVRAALLSGVVHPDLPQFTVA
jgi:glutamyl-Q tRNA(Asp) synthetase